MYPPYDDMVLCADEYAYCVDNPLGGRRYGYEDKSKCSGDDDAMNSSAGNDEKPPKLKNSSPTNVEHRLVEMVASLPQPSVLDISCLTMNESLIYLLGTDHVNPKCQLEVSRIIGVVRPDIVLVELCKLRACRCSSHMNSIFQNPAQFTFCYLKKVIGEIGFIPAFVFMADVFHEMLVSNNINLEFGGEMTGAMRQARYVHHCQLLLGDRPIAITIRRRASAMSWWTKIRLVVQVTLALSCRPLRAILLTNAHHVAETDAMTRYIFVFERDLCLVNALQMSISDENRPVKVVAVVGGGHIAGIHRYWGKMTPDIARRIYEPEFDYTYY